LIGQALAQGQRVGYLFKGGLDFLLVVDHRQSLADQIAAQERYLASLNITLQRATALYRHGAVS
jgi:Cu(I)/Ag(I) efflux system outer membrane protein